MTALDVLSVRSVIKRIINRLVDRRPKCIVVARVAVETFDPAGQLVHSFRVDKVDEESGELGFVAHNGRVLCPTLDSDWLAS